MPMPGDEKSDDDKPLYDASKDACDPNNFDKFLTDEDEEIVTA